MSQQILYLAKDMSHTIYYGEDDDVVEYLHLINELKVYIASRQINAWVIFGNLGTYPKNVKNPYP